MIQNGGFENNTCTGSAHSFCPNSNNYNCNIANWICTGGGALTYAFICNNTFSFIPEGTKAAYFGNQYCNVCSTSFSDTSCLTNTGCAVSGIPSGYPISVNPGYGGTTGISLEQTIMGMTSGTTYVLEFWVGGEANGETGRGLFAVNVGFGNTMFRDKVTAPITGIGSRYDIIFNATSSSHTIKFTNWGHMGNNCTELVLDDVKLYQLNEISSQNPCSNLGKIEQN